MTYVIASRVASDRVRVTSVHPDYASLPRAPDGHVIVGVLTTVLYPARDITAGDELRTVTSRDPRQMGAELALLPHRGDPRCPQPKTHRPVEA